MFKILTVMNKKCIDVWDMMPWSLVEVYGRSEEFFFSFLGWGETESTWYVRQ
jgi:hypothetical protein